MIILTHTHTQGLSRLAANQHNIFDLDKTTRFSCASDRVRTSGHRILSPTLCQLNHPVTLCNSCKDFSGRVPCQIGTVLSLYVAWTAWIFQALFYTSQHLHHHHHHHCWSLHSKCWLARTETVRLSPASTASCGGQSHCVIAGQADQQAMELCHSNVTHGLKKQIQGNRKPGLRKCVYHCHALMLLLILFCIVHFHARQ